MTDKGGGEEPTREGEAEALKKLARSGEAEEIEELPSPPELARQDIRQDIQLKRKYANVLLWMMGGQLTVANIVFVVYAWAGTDWHIETGVIQVWLAATVVQIIGVVLVVVRYLFPRRDV
jgi:hypothetical protein